MFHENVFKYGPEFLVDGILSGYTGLLFVSSKGQNIWIEVEFACLLEVKGLWLTNKLHHGSDDINERAKFPASSIDWNFQVQVATSKTEEYLECNTFHKAVVELGELVHVQCNDQIVGKDLRLNWMGTVDRWAVNEIFVVDSTFPGLYTVIYISNYFVIFKQT